MIPRVLLLALPLILAGEGPGEDPFLAALRGRAGPDAVTAPSFDAEAEAFAWSLRPRREIVDGLAALLLRGEAEGWAEPAKEPSLIPPPPSRIPEEFDPAGVPVTDRLAAWVPADAAALFFPSLREAEDLVAGMAEFLPRALPLFCGDPPGGRREALRRAAERLLLPTVWGANPGIRTGTRQVALVAADPDLRWGADVALVAEVDDASLVAFHRRSSMRWEGRGSRVLRVDGLDALSDDGTIRSFFGMRGGVAVWSTTGDLRDRILAAGEGKGDSLLRPDPRAYALARRTFPAEEGGALLVVPDGFLARANSAGLRSRRAAALRCDAARLLLDAGSLGRTKVSQHDTVVLSCPAGGDLRPVAGDGGASCSVHGTAADPVPLGDLPAAGADAGPASAPRDPLATGGIPPAARWAEGRLAVLVPPGPGGAAVLRSLSTTTAPGAADPWEREKAVLPRIDGLARTSPSDRDPLAVFARLTGSAPWSSFGHSLSLRPGEPAAWDGGHCVRRLAVRRMPEHRSGGGVLAVALGGRVEGGSSEASFEYADLLLVWR